MSSPDAEVTVSVVEAQEYVSKFLGFTPLDFSDELYNIFTDLLTDCIDNFCSEIEKQFGDRISTRKLDNIRLLLKSKCSVQQDNAFSTLEEFLLEKVFVVNPDVVLPDDLCHVRYPDAKCEALDAAISEAERRLVGVNKMLECLTDEEAAATACLKHLDARIASLNSLMEKKFDVSGLAELSNRAAEATVSVNKATVQAYDYFNGT